jgi:filamentous hemagglutinin family protein
MPFPRNRLRPARLASLAYLATASAFTFGPSHAQNILPSHGVVMSGVASIGQSGANMTVNQASPRAIVNWGSFSIGPANGVTFDQPSASSAILNRVTGSTTSTIAGQLQANGQVYLVNPNGIAITKSGAVQVGGGFVASTLGITDDDFNKGNLNFVGNGASAGVSNAGSIAAAAGGFVGLLGGTVSNAGVVSVPLGKVAMGSGEQATLNLTGDNFLQVAVPTNTKTADGQALIDVSGKIRAAGGSVQLKAATVAQAIRNAVNVPGELSVTSARASGGSIILGGGPGGNVSVAGRLKASGRTAGGTIAVAGRDVALRQAKLAASSAKGRGGAVTVTGTRAVSLASSSVDASGATGGGAIRIGGDFHGASDLTSAKTTAIDSASTLNASATVSGDGGTVAVWSDTTTAFAGQIAATGGPNGGNGGYAEVSANPANHSVLDFTGRADLTAAKGTTGTLLLDPFDIAISTGTDSGGAFSGGNPNTWNPTGTSVINNATLENLLANSNVVVSTGFAGSPGIDAGNLTVVAPILWSSNTTLNLTAFNVLAIRAPISNSGGGQLVLNAVGSAPASHVSIGSPISTTTGNISVTGPAVLDANVTTKGGFVDFFNPVTLGTNATVDAGSGFAAFAGTVDGGHVLTVVGSTVDFFSNVGSIAPLGGLSVSGVTNLFGNVTTNNGAITFNGPVLLETNVTLNSGTATTTFGGTVDSACEDCSVPPPADLTASAGAFRFGGALGGKFPLGAVSLTSTNGVTLPSITASSLSATASSGGITLSGPLTVAGTVALNAAGDVVQTSGASIDPTDLTIVSTSGGITLNTSVTASGSVTLSAANDIIETTTGSVFTPTLSAISATGKVVMTSLNSVASVSGSAQQGFSFTDNGDFSVGGSGITTTTGSIFLWADGDGFGTITQTSPIVGPALLAMANADVNLNTATNAVATVGGTAGGEFVFKNAAPTLTVGPVSYFTSTASTTPLLVTSPAAVSGGDCDANCPANVVVSNVGNLAISPGSNVNTPPFGDVVLSATGNFINNAGAGAVSTPAGNWEIYSASPTGDVFGGLDSGQTAIWNTTFSGTVSPTTVNRYLFAFQPTITVTSGDLTKSYGQDVTSLVATDFTITGLQPGVAGAFVGDTPGSVFSGTPSVTSLGAPARASVAGSPYSITVGQGTFAASDNYALVLDSAGRLTIDPLPLTYVVADANSIYGTIPILGAATLSGVLAGDTVAPTVGAFSGTTPVALTPRTPAGAYSEQVTALSSPNYVIAASGNTPGTLTIDPLALTYAVANATSTYGTTATLGAATLTGVLAGDMVDPTVGAFSGTTPVAIGPRTPAGAYSEEVTALSNPNYAVALSGNAPGTLTIDPLAITFSVADASSIFGTTPILGPATLFGVLPGDVVIPTVDAFLGAAPIALSPFTPVGRYAQLVTAISNPNYRVAPGPNFPGVLTVSAPTANPGAPSDPGFLPGLTQINNPAQTEYDVGGYEQVLPHFTVACNEPPSLPDPNRFSDPDQALRAISQSMENYFRRCQNPTQTTIGDALDAYAAKLQVLAPRLPPALRNVPAIVAEGAKRVRAAASRAEAVAVLRQTVAAVHKEIALVLSDDPQTRSREVRDGDVIAGALGDANVALVNSGGL